MRDKTTILVVIGCLVALFAWQALVSKLFPPKPRQAPPIPVQVQETNGAPRLAPSPEPSPAETAAPPAGTAVELAEERPVLEETVVLADEYTRWEFTNRGGGIQRIELLQHRDNGGNVVLNGTGLPPVLALRDLPGAGPQAGYQIEQAGAQSVTMRRRLGDGREVTKTFRLEGGYQLRCGIEVTDPTAKSLKPILGTATLSHLGEPPDYRGVGWLAGGKYQHREVKHATKHPERGAQGEATQARWAAVKNQFFALLLTPATNEVAAVGYEKIDLPEPTGWKGKQPPPGLTGWVELPPTASADGRQTYEFILYAGPKEYDRLAALGAGQEQVMQFGFWSVISIVLLKSMNFFYRLIPNYGVAIILITIVIKILFWPIQQKSIRSMKEMQKFQPVMQKLREKYKDDPQRMNQEMMKLYKEHKINPFAGCLPMLVQIPVFFALFTMLRSAVELRGAGFLWIQDLSQPDTIARLAGFPVNPLPLAMGVSMIWQMKLTPTAGDPKQQQIMMFMPLMFLFICYNMSSGLVLYWTVQQFLSIAQQWWSLRRAEPAPAAGQTKVK